MKKSKIEAGLAGFEGKLRRLSPAEIDMVSGAGGPQKPPIGGGPKSTSSTDIQMRNHT